MRKRAAIVAFTTLLVVSLAAVAVEQHVLNANDVGEPSAHYSCRMPPGPPGMCTPL